jgi:hypothetical protein
MTLVECIHEHLIHLELTLDQVVVDHWVSKIITIVIVSRKFLEFFEIQEFILLQIAKDSIIVYSRRYPSYNNRVI